MNDDKNCESYCPLLRVCQDKLDECDSFFNDTIVQDAEKIVVDSYQDYLNDILNKQGHASPEKQAKRDQLSAGRNKAGAELEAYRRSHIKYIEALRTANVALKYRALESCSGPRARKRYLIFGETILACTSHLAKHNYIDDQEEYRAIDTGD